MRSVYLVLFLVGGILSPSNGSIVDDFFKKAFEQLRGPMKDLYIPSTNIGNLTLVNVFIDGLDKFITSQLSATLFPSVITNMTLVVNEMAAEGRYKMDGMTLPGGISLSGKGNLNLHVTGLRLYTKATYISKAGKVLINTIQELEVTTTSIELSLENIGGGGPISDLINRILNALVTPLFNNLAGPMLLQNSATLIPAINKVLSQLEI